MIFIKKISRLPYLFFCSEALLFILGFSYALYWQSIAPAQFTGDSDTYMAVARMLLSDSRGNAPIFRPPGYPLFLLLTGTIHLGTFEIVLFVQAVFAGIVPTIIYRVIKPYRRNSALAAALISIFSGVVTVHTSQIMTEPLYTVLLFLGIGIAVQLVRSPLKSSNNIYWFALIFALLNTVRPIGAPIFWMMLMVIGFSWWNGGLLRSLKKKLVNSAFIFMSVMAAWIIVDDVLFSVGARYSPLNSIGSGSQSKFANYFYDLPFYEAYYDIWARRVNDPDVQLDRFASLVDRPALSKIRDVVREHLVKYDNKLESDTINVNSISKISGQPDALVYKMFAEPNYIYANYVRSALEVELTDEERMRLYYAAGHEINRVWPMRWIYLFAYEPQNLLLGPTKSAGGSYFLVAYTSLNRCSELKNNKNCAFVTLVNPSNGPASRLMFSTLEQTLNNHPDIWNGYNRMPEWGLFEGDVNALLENMLSNPDQNYSWFMQVMLWNLMGYNTGSDLMGKAALETFRNAIKPLLSRSLNSLLNVMLGSEMVQIDNSLSKPTTVDIYEYLETAQMDKNHIKELEKTRIRYEGQYLELQAPVKTLYEYFYITKPFFCITCLIGIGIVWVKRYPLAVPFLLLIPYGISVGIYSFLFTALPRYTDPTVLIPIIVSFITLESVIDALKKFRQKSRLGNFQQGL